MAGTGHQRNQKGQEIIPPGATTRATERDERPGGPPHTPAGDLYAAGTPGGGTEVGGLGGTNIDEGSPQNADLEATMGGETEQQDIGADIVSEEEGPYSGISGGAVGGTPAEGRSTGGNIQGGLRPGGVHRGDSTIGSDPDKA